MTRESADESALMRFTRSMPITIFRRKCGFLVPTRNASLFRRCLEYGLRVVHPNTLMSMGLYNEPSGAWIPSLLY